MRVIILGGDGFCGWPTSLHLSSLGYDVLIVDNLSRRKIDIELECESLTPIQPIKTRIESWKRITGKTLLFENFNISKHYHRLVDLLKNFKPEVIVHFAEQRAAPYSMKSSYEKRYTVDNNINATHNLMSAIVESGIDIHVVHLGTMGVYGYTTNGIRIPEGYLNITFKNQLGAELSREILFPPSPGSVYHMTKVLDQFIFEFYNRNDGVRVTDLHQGIVWGTQTECTKLSEDLINRFDYDGDYGTVLNRFLVEGAIGYPLSVHGSGGQARAFIHITDTARCIELAIKNAPSNFKRVRVFNQMTEVYKVRDLAELIGSLTGTKIETLVNPRNEADENDLDVENAGLMELGLDPIKLTDGLMDEILVVANRYKDRININKIPCSSYWNNKIRRQDNQ